MIQLNSRLKRQKNIDSESTHRSAEIGIGMDAWNWFDFIRTQLTFLKPGPAEWRLFPFPTYDSSSFHGKWIESAHGSSAFPRTSFNSTSDSSIFGKHWFESTRDSCGNIFDLNKLISKLWVIPKSASNTGSRSVREVHTGADSVQGWQVRVRCWALGKGMYGSQDPFRTGLWQVQGRTRRARPGQCTTSDDGALISVESTQWIFFLKYDYSGLISKFSIFGRLGIAFNITKYPQRFSHTDPTSSVINAEVTFLRYKSRVQSQ